MAWVPQKKMSKCHVNLSINSDLIVRARIRGINISDFLESNLKEHLNMMEGISQEEKRELRKKDLKDELLKQQSKMLATVQELKYIEEQEKKENAEYQKKLDTGEIIIDDDVKEGCFNDSDKGI